MKRKIDFYTSDVLKKKRYELKITQQNLADMTGLSKGFINSVENKNKPNRLNCFQINLISECLKCSPKDFFPNEPIPED
jgi:transcriptional regulator with XRE-family HTH domain